MGLPMMSYLSIECAVDESVSDVMRSNELEQKERTMGHRIANRLKG